MLNGLKNPSKSSDETDASDPAKSVAKSDQNENKENIQDSGSVTVTHFLFVTDATAKRRLFVHGKFFQTVPNLTLPNLT